MVLVLPPLLFSGCRNEPGTPQFETVRTLETANESLGEPFGIATIGDEIVASDGERGLIRRIGQTYLAPVMGKGLKTPSGISFGKDGDLFVADSGSHSIKKVGPSLSTFAGVDDQAGYRDGTVSEALFRGPTGIAVASNGKVLVADTYNDKIRAIENGNVSTIAGGSQGFADGAGASAQFDTPLGVAIWGERLLVADAGNRRIRVVEPDGRVWTLAGNGESALVDGFPLQASFVRPTAIAVSPDGAIYFADGNAIRVIGRRSFALVETISHDRRGFRDGNPLTAQFNRPSGLAFDDRGRLLVADSDNGLVRIFDFEETKKSGEAVKPAQSTAEEFRSLQPPRWPYDPPSAKRDIAGTLGEIRGEYDKPDSFVRFHNGLDIAGAYGETARFLRAEKVLDPMAAENFGNLRELLRLPTIGYIHINLGRDVSGKPFGDPRFIFSNDSFGKLNGVRVPRGAKFEAGEPVGTLNAMNHIHMIAGPTGGEMNALAALTLPNVSDSIAPTIEDVSLFDENWNEIETPPGASRIKLSGKTRIVVRAFDRMDGNPERRKLGVYRLGYQLLQFGGDVNWSITFDRNPPPEAVKTVYATGSQSGPTGETIFNYIVTNRLNADAFGEDFLDASRFENGTYKVRVFAADFFGNQTYKDIEFEVRK